MNTKNKVLFNCRNIHVAFKTVEGWDTPIHIPGTVGFNMNPEGGESTFWADGIKYYVINNNNGYTGDLEAAVIPDDILVEMLGWFVDINGLVVEDADGEPKHFAIMGEVEGDLQLRRFIYYDVLANRPSKSAATKTDTVTPATQTLPLVALPVPLEFDGKMVNTPKGEIERSEANKEVFETFFETVYVPVSEIPVP